jgi:hypothetical protein
MPNSGKPELGWEKVAAEGCRMRVLSAGGVLAEPTPHPSEFVAGTGAALSHKGRGYSDIKKLDQS